MKIFPVTQQMTDQHPANPSPLNRTQVLDRYFLEHRAKLVDIAAFLDRVDRAQSETQAGSSVPKDFRLEAFRIAIKILSDPNPQRAKRILESLSDPTHSPALSAQGKGAVGAYPLKNQQPPPQTDHNGETP